VVCNGSEKIGGSSFWGRDGSTEALIRNETTEKGSYSQPNSWNFTADVVTGPVKFSELSPFSVSVLQILSTLLKSQNTCATISAKMSCGTLIQTNV
jgi:hypothetical protein